MGAPRRGPEGARPCGTHRGGAFLLAADGFRSYCTECAAFQTEPKVGKCSGCRRSARREVCGDSRSAGGSRPWNALEGATVAMRYTCVYTFAHRIRFSTLGRGVRMPRMTGTEFLIIAVIVVAVWFVQPAIHALGRVLF